ncbi:MAG TPA: SUMF1/EgtB/PvdO family nonheme iron enzyme, partial [Tepidisphaeraceae bacterium]
MTTMSKLIGAIIFLAALAVGAAWGIRTFSTRRAAADHAKAVAQATPTPSATTQPAACCMILPKRFAAGPTTAPAGMVWIPGGQFTMGSTTPDARPDERPLHPVKVSGFWMDQTDVTNARFRKFVEATHYVTTAEKKPDWEEMKKQLPPGTPKPPEEQLVAASIVFHAPPGPVPLNDISQWWAWVPGADWRHP